MPAVLAVTSADALAAHAEAWDRLAAEAIEPNLFYERWMLLPGARAFVEPPDRFEAVLVSEGDRLIGLFPLLRRRLHRAVPIETVRLFDHLQSCLCIPLVHATDGALALHAFLDWLAGQGGAAFAELARIGGAGPLHALLCDVLLERRAFFQTTMQTTRAMLERTDDPEETLARVVSSKTRGKLRRYEKALAADGTLSFHAAPGDGDVETALEEFLALEASGWKGKDGTALASSSVQRTFFLETMRAAHARGRLEILSLRVGGRPAAMKCNLWDGIASYTYKTAFDERHAKQSPGLLLELESMRRLSSRKTLRFMDSAGSPKNGMYDRLWPSRRPLQTMLVGSGRAAGLAVSSLPLARWAARTARAVMGQSKGKGPAAGEAPPAEAQAD